MQRVTSLGDVRRAVAAAAVTLDARAMTSILPPQQCERLDGLLRELWARGGGSVQRHYTRDRTFQDELTRVLASLNWTRYDFCDLLRRATHQKGIRNIAERLLVKLDEQFREVGRVAQRSSTWLPLFVAGKSERPPPIDIVYLANRWKPTAEDLGRLQQLLPQGTSVLEERIVGWIRSELAQRKSFPRDPILIFIGRLGEFGKLQPWRRLVDAYATDPNARWAVDQRLDRLIAGVRPPPRPKKRKAKTTKGSKGPRLWTGNTRKPGSHRGPY